MPKKLSVNTKAEEARARQAAVAAEARQRALEKQEDEKWRDDDKHVNAKLNRRNETQQKAEDRASRRAETRRMAEEEERALTSRRRAESGGPAKLTRAEIARRALVAAQEKKTQHSPNGSSSTNGGMTESSAPLTVQDEPLAENPNHAILRQMRDEGLESIVISSSLEQAVADLSLADDSADRHPEKRMKAAMKAYEEEQLPILRNQNPTLKRSQLLEILWKQWKKAPENPLNQQRAARA